MVIFHDCPIAHFWHCDVWSFQNGLSDAHCEHDLVSVFHIGRSGGHSDVCVPDGMGYGRVMFSHWRVIGLSCCPTAHCTAHMFLVRSYVDPLGHGEHFLDVIL